MKLQAENLCNVTPYSWRHVYQHTRGIGIQQFFCTVGTCQASVREDSDTNWQSFYRIIPMIKSRKMRGTRDTGEMQTEFLWEYLSERVHLEDVSVDGG